MNKKIKKVMIELVQRDGFNIPNIELKKGEEFDDKIQDAISDLVAKGVGFFAENTDKIIVITEDNKRIKVRADNYFYG